MSLLIRPTFSAFGARTRKATFLSFTSGEVTAGGRAPPLPGGWAGAFRANARASRGRESRFMGGPTGMRRDGRRTPTAGGSLRGREQERGEYVQAIPPVAPGVAAFFG